jgi:hypothetical protein
MLLGNQEMGEDLINQSQKYTRELLLSLKGNQRTL